VVSWRLDQHMPTALVLTALEQALTLRKPAPGPIIDADRGSQYTSLACRTRIEKALALASYSRPSNPYDNARSRLTGAPSKPNYSRTAVRLPASKGLAWMSPTTLIPTSISAAATLLWATARPTNLNATA
jgi:hypothetical protein